MNTTFGAYPHYRDSGVAWLGAMPAKWNLLRAKLIFDRVQRQVRPEDGVVTAFRDGQVTLRSNRRTAGFTNAVKEIGYQGVRVGDLLVHAMDGFAGAIGVSDSDGKCSPVCSVCVPRLNAQLNVKYYGYLVRQLAVTDFITSLAKGIRERSTEFRFSEFANLSLAVPSLAEQTQIAKFLDYETSKIDALIEKQQQLIALLKEKRQAVISHAVTKGLNPDAPMRDSGVEWLGEVPAHWVVRELKQSIEPGSSISYGIVQPGEPLEKGTPFVQTTNISRGSFGLESLQKTTAQIAAAFPRSRLSGGEVILGIRASIGAAYVVPSHLRGCNLSRGIARIKPATDLSAAFLVCYLRSQTVAHYWGLSSQGSTFSEVSIDTVKKLYLAIPGPEEQANICRFLEENTSGLDELIVAADYQSSLLQERRTALISAAVTGKIDVRNWQAPESENGTEAV